jgi:hypothetical protein
MVRDIINGVPPPAPTPNPGAPAPIPPEVVEKLLNPQVIIPVQNIPVPPPPVPFRPEPVAGPSWLRWDWATGILILCLLAGAGRAAARLSRPAANGPSKPGSEEARD